MQQYIQEVNLKIWTLTKSLHLIIATQALIGKKYDLTIKFI